MESYTRTVFYYETDRMGVTHHSNYIRWMEEARLDFFKQIGFDYIDFENMGIISPVIRLNNIKYIKPTTFGDTIAIKVSINSYNRLVVGLHYKMYKNDELVFEGDSEHCFIKDNKMIRLSDDNFKDFHHKLLELKEKAD